MYTQAFAFPSQGKKRMRKKKEGWGGGGGGGGGDGGESSDTFHSLPNHLHRSQLKFTDPSPLYLIPHTVESEHLLSTGSWTCC